MVSFAPAPQSKPEPDELYLPPLPTEASIIRISNLHHVKVDEQLLTRTTRPARPTRDQTMAFRQTDRQYLLTSLLQDGFHRASSELFNLERALGQSGERQTQLTSEERQHLAQFLKEMELARREHDSPRLYDSLSSAAESFSEIKLISDYFLQLAHTVASNAQDGGRSEARSHRSLGLHTFETEEYHKASFHLHQYLRMVTDGGWASEHDERDACDKLRQLYIRLGDLSKDKRDILENYEKALQYAVKCEDAKHLKQVNYKLALVHEKLGDFRNCSEKLATFFSLCDESHDFTNVAAAAQLFGKVYEIIKTLDNVQQSIATLDAFVRHHPSNADSSDGGGYESSDDSHESFGAVCGCLGNVFTSDNNLDRAQEYLKLSYEAAIARNDRSALNESKMRVAIASAHQMLADFASCVDAGGRQQLLELLNWKTTREKDFLKSQQVD